MQVLGIKTTEEPQNNVTPSGFWFFKSSVNYNNAIPSGLI
jgi:hypothetical protein